MLRAISATEARNTFLPLLDKVCNGERYMVTRHGQPVVVVLSYEEYSRIEATLRLIENRKIASDIASGFEDEKEDRLTPLD
ncbi:MAG: type II toxin-antitoxin system Phd/YefM family antitoxin [Dehalococcoidales bacterium]|jgi:prevent-host-death family protein|nr:type II toxin-antitoxin system Phd/YefM family antitoxin [Dehalococcoidales bacterium]MDD3264742.1 type II toxin-antitoxin system Phd/YefM family antitoxin [Dehalococcoidales bacterium]MDD4322345.1 type II toxin-antitoxin system Phd/YefM family antitoxin [Dehalococcoidales bacterium]MDD5498533.1 type II toxin-antitoxin system Phd/YefM family antitoxin [Dehalococcoidales bacterium]MDX9803134.1 type II toxin-antitoxin system Phd/YefM family antitoxin [Dehalococcoidales bacterium]